MIDNNKNQKDKINDELIKSYEISYIFENKPLNRFKTKPTLEEKLAKLDNLKESIKMINNIPKRGEIIIVRVITNDIKSSNKVKRGLTGIYNGLDILGPAPCHFEKIKTRYRVQLIFKSLKKFDPNSKRLQLFIAKNFINNQFNSSTGRCKINIHRDPLSLL